MTVLLLFAPPPLLGGYIYIYTLYLPISRKHYNLASNHLYTLACAQGRIITCSFPYCLSKSLRRRLSPNSSLRAREFRLCAGIIIVVCLCMDIVVAASRELYDRIEILFCGVDWIKLCIFANGGRLVYVQKEVGWGGLIKDVARALKYLKLRFASRESPQQTKKEKKRN